MPLLLDPLMVFLADLILFKDVSQNMDEDRVNQSVREAQINELRSFVGDELYLALITDYDEISDTFSQDRFNDLWFGVDYDYTGKTIRFHGLKAAIIYYTYARMLDNGQLNLTRSGAKSWQNDESEDTEQPQIATKVRNARSQALVYLSDAKKFLSYLKSVYPEWEEEKQDRTSLQFFKV